MKPKWLIEHFDDRNSTQLLIEEVERQGYELATIKYEPFGSGSYKMFGDEDCVIVQSSINFAQQIMRERPKWVPGPWMTEKNYRCTSYYTKLGKYLFNDTYVMMTRDEAMRNMDKVFKWVGRGSSIFMRPDSGMKCFTGRIFEIPVIHQDWSWVEMFTEPDTLVVLSTPKDIKAEWRFVVCGKDIIAGSQYECNGELNVSPMYPEEAKDLAREVAGIYQPDPMFVIDVCMGMDNGYYLMEIGAFSVAGLYACDLKPIVERASETALAEWNDIYMLP